MFNTVGRNGPRRHGNRGNDGIIGILESATCRSIWTTKGSTRTSSMSHLYSKVDPNRNPGDRNPCRLRPLPAIKCEYSPRHSQMYPHDPRSGKPAHPGRVTKIESSFSCAFGKRLMRQEPDQDAQNGPSRPPKKIQAMIRVVQSDSVLCASLMGAVALGPFVWDQHLAANGLFHLLAGLYRVFLPNDQNRLSLMV